MPELKQIFFNLKQKLPELKHSFTKKEQRFTRQQQRFTGKERVAAMGIKEQVVYSEVVSRIAL